jgi:hypothetical protein
MSEGGNEKSRGSGPTLSSVGLAALVSLGCRHGRVGHQKSRGPDLAHGSGSSGRRSCRLRSSSSRAQISHVQRLTWAQRIGGGSAGSSSYLAASSRGLCTRLASRSAVYARRETDVNPDGRRCRICDG